MGIQQLMAADAINFGSAQLPGTINTLDTQVSPTDCVSGITFNSGGSYSNSGNGSDAGGVWYNSGDLTKFWVKLDQTGGDSSFQGAPPLGTWVLLSSNPAWGLTGSGAGAGTHSAIGTLSIKSVVNGISSSILATSTLTVAINQL